MNSLNQVLTALPWLVALAIGTVATFYLARLRRLLQEKERLLREMNTAQDPRAHRIPPGTLEDSARPAPDHMEAVDDAVKTHLKDHLDRGPAGDIGARLDRRAREAGDDDL